jgi:hypothetical protein
VSGLVCVYHVFFVDFPAMKKVERKHKL